MNSKFRIVLFLLFFIFVSLRYGTEARHAIGGVNNKVLAAYVAMKMNLEDKIDEHFAQKEEIARLKAENQKMQASAILSIAFASKLNALLKEHNSSAYTPQVALVKTIGYSNLNDYGKVWIDYDDFNQSKIYGLLHQGYAAGIVVQSDGHPQGLMLSDPKAIFSVMVGAKKMPGIAQGNRKDVLVKYISQWLLPQVGDEVVTSGLDGIFFEGIKVGTVTEIIEEESSKTVKIKPYIEPVVPAYMHIIVNP